MVSEQGIRVVESETDDKFPLKRRAWFGDTHVHTNYSVDASIYNVRVTPDDAYRYARGESINHTSGKKYNPAVQLISWH